MCFQPFLPFLLRSPFFFSCLNLFNVGNSARAFFVLQEVCAFYQFSIYGRERRGGREREAARDCSSCAGESAKEDTKREGGEIKKTFPPSSSQNSATKTLYLWLSPGRPWSLLAGPSLSARSTLAGRASPVRRPPTTSCLLFSPLLSPFPAAEATAPPPRPRPPPPSPPAPSSALSALAATTSRAALACSSAMQHIAQGSRVR